MPRFLADAFAGPAGANLASRSGTIGADWTQLSSASIVLSNANRARGSSNQLARYVASGIPATADCDAAGTTFRQSGVGEWAVMVRADPAADSCYVGGYRAGAWELRRYNAGAETVLATLAAAWADNTLRPWRLKVRGTNPVTLELRDALVNGDVLLAATDSDAGRITAAGQVGLRIHAGTAVLFENRGYHVGLLTATALPADARPRAAKPALGQLAQRILAKAAAERAAERAAILAEAGAPAPWQTVRGGTTYTLSLPDGISRDARGLLMIPRVVCDPAPPLPLDPPYYFGNPPVTVADGSVREEADRDGEPVLVPNFIEDAAEAIRQIVAECVLRTA